MTEIGRRLAEQASGISSGGPKPFLSYSQLSTFLRCPRQYQYRYMRGMRPPATGVVVQSRAFHETLARNFRLKAASGSDLPLSEMLSFFVERFEQALAHGEVALEPHEKAGILKDQGAALVAVHHRDIASSVRPSLVEHRFRIGLGEEAPFDLVGVWDLVEQDGVVVDHKAYRKAPTQEMVDHDLQIGLYALAFCTLSGDKACDLRIDAVIKDANPWVRQIHTRRTLADCEWMKALLIEVGRAIEAKRFYPNPTGWFCTPRFCPAWTRCMNLPIPKEVPHA